MWTPDRSPGAGRSWAQLRWQGRVFRRPRANLFVSPPGLCGWRSVHTNHGRGVAVGLSRPLRDAPSDKEDVAIRRASLLQPPLFHAPG